jgi:hypothetical protein
VKSIVENVFPHRYYFGYYGVDSTKIITDWIKKDTTITEKFTAGPGKILAAALRFLLKPTAVFLRMYHLQRQQRQQHRWAWAAPWPGLQLLANGCTP